MPPRRRLPRYLPATISQKRLFINRIRFAFANYRLHINYNDPREVNRQLRLRVEAAARDFLPQNNRNAMFFDQLSSRFVDLIIEKQRQRNLSADAFKQVAENFLDDYMGDVSYYDNGSDDDF